MPTLTVIAREPDAILRAAEATEGVTARTVRASTTKVSLEGSVSALGAILRTAKDSGWISGLNYAASATTLTRMKD